MEYLTAFSIQASEFAASLHWQTYATGLFLWWSYVIFSTLLQYRYYYAKRDIPETWKVAPTKTANLAHSKSWWLPLASYWTSKARGPYHWLFATVNLFVSCCVGSLVTEVCQFP